ncbi:unnamed protein product [Bemisia tabaci]|uniref:Fatty acyl-CoA reductase n=1 Tax=Bemisia tabaci TaxID=7038 RepID=A0A9P0F227_BEMTA|nr:PREDICTED: putative fatty acyl-CoA reductase CG5065 [Bemisia tabaci]CAH0385057.1 unnamed protein product [Bemisia tabaci]
MGSCMDYNNYDGLTDLSTTKLCGAVHGSLIQEFFAGKSVFITGGTGFVGKALVEKLLRSCPKLDKIYLLVRPKKGVHPKVRLTELLKNSVFDRVRAECPASIFEKVICIEGNVTEAGLGLAIEDKATLISNVNVVFHSAATVKFNEALPSAVDLNTRGTKRVIELCHSIYKLEALVHVSTAYSNADKREIQEVVYSPPGNPNHVMECCENMPQEMLDLIAERIQKNHPNTYTVTKAMAEWLVAEQARTLPTAIVRPSIVTAAWREPMPGWVDNISGITGIMMEIGRGTIRSIICDQKLVVDIIPVDFVVNTLIAVAWHTAKNRRVTDRPAVYNCTSGTINPIKWEELGVMTQRHALMVPSRYIQWYPGFSFRTNRLIHWIYEAAFHFLPAVIVDVILRLQGSKPIMLKIFKKFKMAAKTGEFFALNEFNFDNRNLGQLIKEIASSSDQPNFEVDVAKIGWDSYVKQYMLGIRKFVLKDPPETIPGARRKLYRLYWFHRLVQVLIPAGILLNLRFTG